MNPTSNEKVGTIGYMAPEIFTQSSYSFPVDVWAIGTVLYNLIYLAYPFGVDKATYATKANAFLKEIQHVSTYSDKFSKRLKDFLRRFFEKNPEKRDKAAYIYDFEYMHEFRLMEITLSLKKKYEEHIKRVNSCNTLEIERYCLQQHSLYHEKVLEVVRYEQWGYFLFLSNLKVVALFNSDPKNKLIKIFPDCLDDTPNFNEDVHCNILTHVFKVHFKKLRDHLEIKKRVYTKRLNTTIANIVQHKDTLAIRLRPELSGESKRELKKKEGDVGFPSVKKYEQFMPTSANKDPISFDNNTFQVFYFPQEAAYKV
jgi:serine/threonine protein kinase